MARIVILGPAHPLRGGGITTFNERLAQELQSQGHEVAIYSFSLQYPSFLFPGKSQYTDEPAPKDLDIHSRLNSINPLNWWSVGQELRKRKPDLVIVRYWLPFMGPSLGTVLRQVKKNKHSRVVAIVDNIIPHEKRPGDKLFSQYFVHPVDAFVVMSKSVGEDLRHFLKREKPVSYVPHPLYDNYGTLLHKSAARQKLGLPVEGRLVLFFGFIREYKGLDLLYQAMADERVRGMGIRLLVAGEYYVDGKEYEQLARKLGIQDALFLHTQFIGNDRVREYFSAADMVVQPYRTATQSGISQLAYHFEKPMLVTNVGGLPEIVRHGQAGYVVDVDARSIAEALLDFYQNDKEQGFVEQVRKEKKRFSWDNLTQQLLHGHQPE